MARSKSAHRLGNASALAVEALPDLTGKTGFEAVRVLEESGFQFVHETKGGYRKYAHPDGSQVWIRSTGEVIRLGPKVSSSSGKKYHPRYDQQGRRTQSHSTGELLIP